MGLCLFIFILQIAQVFGEKSSGLVVYFESNCKVYVNIAKKFTLLMRFDWIKTLLSLEQLGEPHLLKP